MAEYDTDFYGWTQAQAEALWAKDWAALDTDHLGEEIEDVGNSVRFDIESQLVCLLLHLLKLRHDPATRPRRRALLEMDRPLGGIPESCPLTIAQVLNADFFPER